MRNRVKITYIESDHKEGYYLSKAQFEALNIALDTEDIILNLGAISIPLKRIPLNTVSPYNDRLYLTKDLKSYIPEGAVLQIKKVTENSLELGPLIGVFIDEESFNHLVSGKNLAAYNHFALTCKNLLGLCCFFSMKNIYWSNKLVDGLIRKGSKWTPCTLPLPKVIYDQNQNINNRSEALELRKRLSNECKVLNAIPKLSKLETINILKENPKVKDFLPDTFLYKAKTDVKLKLERYPSLYLKPNLLSKGKGIFKIEKTSYGQYKIQYRTKEQNHIVTLDDLNKLDNLFEKYLDKGCGYILQEEIQKASFKGNAFDMRILFQKDCNQSFEPSGIAVRLAPPGSIITSPRSGGNVEELSTILKEVFKEDFKTKHGLYESLINLGREVCLSIEKKFGDCVELGLDLAIDINHKIWLIEVNLKPLKVSLSRLKDSKTISTCYKRPIEYCAYLCGFN